MERPQTGGQPMSLESLLAQGYRTVVMDSDAVEIGSEALAEALNPNIPVQQVVNPAQGQEEIDTQEVASTGGESVGVTTQQQVQPETVDSQLIAELQSELSNVRQQAQTTQDMLVRATNERLAIEERAFIESLQDEDEAVAAKKLLDYRTRQHQARERFLVGRLQGIEKQAEADQQMISKRQLSFILARMNGLPREMVQFLDSAQTPDDMRQKAETLGKMFVGNSQEQKENQRQARISSGVDVAGGERSGNVPPVAPKERSGDILGYIRSRNHQVVNAWEG